MNFVFTTALCCIFASSTAATWIAWSENMVSNEIVEPNWSCEVYRGCCFIPYVRDMCPEMCGVRRDCVWRDYGPYGLCRGVTNDSNSGGVFRYAKKRVRTKIRALNGGTDCVGKEVEYTACSIQEYTASTFVRTIFSKRSDAGPLGTARKKCSGGVYDEKMQLVMSGRKCSPGRRRKRTVFNGGGTKQNIWHKPRDVLFVLDESGSIRRENFKSIIAFVKAICKKFGGWISIGKTRTRVGVVTFDNCPQPIIDFDSYFSKEELIDAIDAIPYNGGGTCIQKALSFSKDTMFTGAHGSRPEADKLVIIVTDACEYCGPRAVNCEWNSGIKPFSQLGYEFSAAGIPVLNFVITRSKTCFASMKGLDDGSECYQQFTSSSWLGLNAITRIIDRAPIFTEWVTPEPCRGFA